MSWPYECEQASLGFDFTLVCRFERTAADQNGSRTEYM